MMSVDASTRSGYALIAENVATPAINKPAMASAGGLRAAVTASTTGPMTNIRIRRRRFNALRRWSSSRCFVSAL
jgi:hypothetical protein